MPNQGVETDRINLLVARDGEETARAWVERTLALYRSALADPHSYASTREYRPLFEQSVQEFERWLAGRESR
ncbi:MAG: hypothetical protein AB1710_00215 [Pseudomonadota bacterium]